LDRTVPRGAAIVDPSSAEALIVTIANLADVQVRTAQALETSAKLLADREERAWEDELGRLRRENDQLQRRRRAAGVGTLAHDGRSDQEGGHHEPDLRSFTHANRRSSAPHDRRAGLAGWNCGNLVPIGIASALARQGHILLIKLSFVNAAL
jgi:hypothetical protein